MASDDGVSIQEMSICCDGPTHEEPLKIGTFVLITHRPLIPGGSTREIEATSYVQQSENPHGLLIGNASMRETPASQTEWERLADAGHRKIRSRFKFECPTCMTNVEIRIPKDDTCDFDAHPLVRLFETGLTRISLRLLELLLSRQGRNRQ